MKKIVVLLLSILVVSCASPEVKSPCPNFGLHCEKIRLYGSKR